MYCFFVFFFFFFYGWDSCLFFFFFFQAEDGIRDFHVTGVQTCALPISPGSRRSAARRRPRRARRRPRALRRRWRWPGSAPRAAAVGCGPSGTHSALGLACDRHRACGRVARVNLDASGDPIHTRALGVTLAWRADGRLDARGQILDLRKRGFVPMVGDLRPSGLVHHMRVRAVIDPVARSLDEIEAEQPAVAFEIAPWTQGESCRDTIPGVRGLAPAPLDAAFAKRVGAAICGPRGCSHVMA